MPPRSRDDYRTQDDAGVVLLSARGKGRVECLAKESDLENLGEYELHAGDVRDAYPNWPSPTTIISDGAYGVGGFPGDPRTAAELPSWYAEHFDAWSEAALPSTTLWLWNSEAGWASVHNELLKRGWHYEQCNTWNKGIGQVAGNVNGNSIRRFPTVTEVCVLYSRAPTIFVDGLGVSMKVWLRSEWQRTGLTMKRANEACGVKDAATRKYFDQGWLWYFPPPEVMQLLADYANKHGDPEGRPYYSLNGQRPVTSQEWAAQRYKWNYTHGFTNVWDRPSLRGAERYRGSGVRSAPRVHKPSRMSTTHLNQKPLDLTELLVRSTTDVGDVVWEPFGGLATGALASVSLGRKCFVAEQVEEFAELALERLGAAGLGQGELFGSHVSGAPLPATDTTV